VPGSNRRIPRHDDHVEAPTAHFGRERTQELTTSGINPGEGAPEFDGEIQSRRVASVAQALLECLQQGS